MGIQVDLPPPHCSSDLVLGDGQFGCTIPGFVTARLGPTYMFESWFSTLLGKGNPWEERILPKPGRRHGSRRLMRGTRYYEVV